MKLRLSLYNLENTTTNEEQITRDFIIEYEEKISEFDVSINSQDENLTYVISNKKFEIEGLSVIVESTYLKHDGSFTLNFTVNDVKIFNSYKINFFSGAGKIMVNSKTGFSFDLIMNEKEIKKTYLKSR